MKISYLLDTDWIIHYLNGLEKIVEKLKSSREEGLAITVSSLAELPATRLILFVGQLGLNL